MKGREKEERGVWENEEEKVEMENGSRRKKNFWVFIQNPVCRSLAILTID